MTIDGNSSQYAPTDRRPIASRETRWAASITEKLCELGFSPNAISIGGMVAAMTAGVCFASTAWTNDWLQRGLFLTGGVLCQFRLLCNLFDGMVAVKKGVASPVGELYNEIPDRISDSAVLIGLGFASGGNWQLGYIAAILAVFMAYVRAVGKSLGTPSDYCGPMAKPQRMAIVTVLSIYLSASPWAGQLPIHEVVLTLGLICVGSVLTSVRRLLRIARRLRKSEG